MRFSSTKGFTLVEVLIIAPIVIIAISGFIALMVTMTADILVTRDQNNMSYETQDALDLIEQDTRLATQFLVTTQALPSPQGSNNNFTGTAAFTNASSTLIMGGLTTDKNPADTTRDIVYYAGQPYVCGTQQSYNRVFLSKVVYFLKDGSLWRRVVLPDYNTNVTLDDNTLCSAPWQRNTCSPGYNPSTRCQTNDSRIMDNVKTFSIKYYDDPDSTTEVTSGDALSAVSIEVNLEGEKTTAGRTIANSGKLRAKKLNNIDVEIPAPSSPDISSQIDGNTVTFTWPKVPLASSYLVTHNTNGGTPTNATLNSQTTSYNVSAGRGDTITFQIQARNSTGTSATTTVAVTIPSWYSCDLLNGWQNYQSGYADASYAKTSADVVVLKGLVRFGTATANTPICQLPVGYRPGYRLVFITSSLNGSVSGTGRIDIAANGEVRFVTGNNGWISLDGLRFVASTASYTWTSPAVQNGWVDYGSDLAPRQTTLDSQGRVHVRGATKDGNSTAGTPIFTLPAGQTRPTQFTYLPMSGGNGFNWVGVGGIYDARLNPVTHLSLQGMFYPGTSTGWTDLTLVNSWTWINLTNHATAQYKKSADGIVTLKGLVKKATNDDGTTIATLPPGYRPKEQLLTSCVAWGGYCRIDIMPDGRIIDNASANNGWVSLDNVSFLADQ
jgi:hypothetical protein